MAGRRLPTRPWYAAGIRFECQGTGACCTNHGEYAWVYLSDEDEERLIEHTGLGRAEFRRRYTRLFQGDRVLRSRDAGCIFLDGHRCQVYPARPVQCSTWPFWRSNLDRRVWQRDVAPFCAGVGKGRLYSREEIDAIAARFDEEE